MTVPDGAIFEAYMGIGSDGRGVVLYDVADLLPRHGTRRYRTRALSDITQQYVHHSGALRGGDSFAHMRGSAAFAVRKNWPGFAYTTWQPFWEVLDHDGNRVVYRGNRTQTRTWHAGKGPNTAAISHVLQGNLTARDMSEAQWNTLPVTLSWFATDLAITDIALGHFQAPADGHAKASCPGRAGKAWVLGYKAGRET